MLTKNSINKISQNQDLDFVKEIITLILGKTCCKTIISYGDELRLEIGDRIACQPKAIAGQEESEWEFGTRGTDWQLIADSGNILTSSAENVELFKSKVKILESTTITKFETNYPDLVLTIGFSNGCELKLFPDLDDDCDVSCWELFTPNNMLLTLEPGGIWTYTRSDVPMGEKINGG